MYIHIFYKFGIILYINYEHNRFEMKSIFQTNVCKGLLLFENQNSALNPQLFGCLEDKPLSQDRITKDTVHQRRVLIPKSGPSRRSYPSLRHSVLLPFAALPSQKFNTYVLDSQSGENVAI